MAYFILKDILAPFNKIAGELFRTTDEAWLISFENEEMDILSIFHPEEKVWKKNEPPEIVKNPILTKILTGDKGWAVPREISKEEATLILFEAE